MHITITGNLGSGKSTICKIIENKYGFEIYSTGKVQRELAKELNMSTLDMNKLMRTDPKYDNMIDDATTKIARENKDKNIIFDSRLAWNFVETSFKVFVSVSLDVAANRVLNDDRGKVEQYSSVEEAKQRLKERAQTEDIRYKDMYQLDYFNYSNYNLIIDSTNNSPEEIAGMIIKEAKEFYYAGTKMEYDEVNKGWNKILVSPKRLLHEEIKNEDQTRLENLICDIKNNSASLKKILVKKIDEDYHIVEGKDEVIAAQIANIPFIEIILTR